MSDDPVTRIVSPVERLRVEVLARIDRLESVSRGSPDLLPARVVAHVQNVGDLEGNLGDWLGERRSGRWIEGFRITPPQDVIPEELLYRVVVGPGQLSLWMPSGRFCGSEGLAQPLRGFCVTLQGAAAENYACSYTDVRGWVSSRADPWRPALCCRDICASRGVSNYSAPTGQMTGLSCH